MSEHTEPYGTRHTILAVPPAPQPECPLYKVPPEIRDLIFTFALTDYLDPAPAKQYGEAIFTRPETSAPRRTDTALLRTCRAIYSECCFIPWAAREHTHWLTSADRSPPEYAKRVQRYGGPIDYFRGWMRHWEERVGVIPEMNHLRVFAQMWSLEQDQLAVLMGMPGVLPRRLTVTIRHTDWWYWEDDEPLHILGGWIEGLNKTLPSVVQEFCIELETIRRKAWQLKAIAKEMGEKWFFKRTDGVVLFPDATGKNVKVSRWAGSSRWDGKRWIRDESSPGRIDYYVMCIPFRPAQVLLREGGKVGEYAQLAADGDIYDIEELDLLPDVRDGIDGRGYIPLDVYGDEIEAAIPGAARNPVTYGSESEWDSDEAGEIEDDGVDEDYSGSDDEDYSDGDDEDEDEIEIDFSEGLVNMFNPS